MQDKPATKTKKRTSLSSVAVLLIVTTFIGQLLGFLRTRLVGANFPRTGIHSTDAYFAAFNIPDLFFYTLAAGALGVAFMPVLAERLHKGDKKAIWDLTSSLLNLLSMVMIGVGVIILVFAKPLIHDVVAPGLPPAELHNAVIIMRLLAFDPLLFTLSGILNSVQQTLGRFFFYSIASLFYNTSIIISIFIFRHTSIGIIGLGIGAVAGAVIQLLVVCCGLIGTKFRWKPKILWHSKDFHTILHQLPPRSLDQGIDQVESIVETHLASNLSAGAISNYSFAYTLQTAPTLLIGTAISTAAFPRLANRLAQGRPDLFRRDFLMILRMMIWLTLPVVIICFYARGYLAHLIFGQNSSDIALIFGYLTVAIFFRTIYTLVSRWYYAQKDTKTPLFVSVFTIALNIILAILWARPSTYGIAGLAMAQSVVAMVEVTILFTIMLLRDHQLLDSVFWGACMRILSVSGFSLVAGFIMVSIFPLDADDRGFLTLSAKFSAIAGITFLTHILVSGLFGLDEARPIFRFMKRVALRPIKITY